MSSIERRDRMEPAGLFDRMDRFFDDWMQATPARRMFPFALWPGEDILRVDEYREGDTLVIRADLPGIDPDKDVTVSVSDGVLRIDAQRSHEEKVEKRGYRRQELRYGSFHRALTLPEGVTDADVCATYTNGVLEIRIPMPEAPAPAEPKKIAISKS
ncbi:Hsp20/alpha crystallin family protein [Pseudonocardia acidicola]|uniref:Hsp20/alpha crystallin family protein n=1 Tax=Pseudonocardia acidicola TaxID=2724939 RepID=A0ABX1SIL7_9PSEU|nr:Hsp20/alpha crystallin family protein [Pseudonocardia acidicola]NMI00333.1 Hsp20/alpha crystallin family protein [Pseudonocardia acidicola]